MLNRPFMSLNVISRTKILDVDLLLLLLFILIKENYSKIIAEYFYGLTIKSTILRLSTNVSSIMPVYQIHSM